ncbi:hypothetical protein BBF96_12000 [Anoxybacter fermentans]|uniref:DUF1934 domain-containing protein n=1 Tax=Anoxybacter fermentans TaxID=1323375 RepID=A0A3Q9HRJ6_9FIRM|nr:DUF1934 domain-containing protein [Anoxybacter fermentans]AZR74053.1 hypothetical protein BBF96_12000 [Anoxybacter fermentans]
MATEILISIKNLQKQDGEKNIINYQTRGFLYDKGQATYLQYEESAEGLEGVRTTLKLEKNRVTLIRHGKVSMCQVFEEGVKDESQYKTSYGSIPLSTDTKRLEQALGFDEGRIRIYYDLYLGDELTSNNTLEIIYQTIQDS